VWHRWVKTLASPEDDGGKSLKRKNIVFALEQFQHFLASHKREWQKKCAKEKEKYDTLSQYEN